MTNQEYLSTLSPEDFYAKLEWLLHDYGHNYTDTREAVINWLKEDYKNPHKWGNAHILNIARIVQVLALFLCLIKTARCIAILKN